MVATFLLANNERIQSTLTGIKWEYSWIFHTKEDLNQSICACLENPAAPFSTFIYSNLTKPGCLETKWDSKLHDQFLQIRKKPEQTVSSVRIAESSNPNEGSVELRHVFLLLLFKAQCQVKNSSRAVKRQSKIRRVLCLYFVFAIFQVLTWSLYYMLTVAL